jgi:ElaB/YqjD/DUF883 family membrane-anchored ribosome-binding protein
MNEITTEKLVADVKVLIADMEDLIKATAGIAGDRVIELRERLESKLAQGKAALAKCEKDLRGRGDQAKACALACWRDAGCRGLVIALGVGLLAGLALRRSR